MSPVLLEQLEGQVAELVAEAAQVAELVEAEVQVAEPAGAVEQAEAELVAREVPVNKLQESLTWT